MSLKIGDQAPDFKLINAERQEVSLSQFSGKNVLILFFPAAFTGVCTEELCSIRDNKAMYDGINAEILSISVDLPFTLAKFKEIQGYNFELLSDFNKEVSLGYDSIYTEWILGFKGVSKRSAFVVDRSGKIRYAEVLENAGEVPNFAAINAVLEEIK
jgi:glutaredoxin-dependent peroxiredoxin